MAKENKQTFLGAAATLGAAVIVVKIIGALYKIPLKNILGDEGVTYFNASYKIYSFLLSLSTAGLPVALSKLVAGYRQDRYLPHYAERFVEITRQTLADPDYTAY